MNAKLSRREREIMDILFRCGEASARDILAQMSSPPSYSAVRAMLAKLLTKNIVQYRRSDNHYVYSPTVSQSKARESALRHLVKTFFNDSPLKAANALLGMDEQGVDDDELARLRAMIDKIDQESP